MSLPRLLPPFVLVALLAPASVLCFGLLGLAGCATVELAPAQAPAREVPKGVEARSLPPEAGTTRVLLDANGTRATVLDIVDQTSATGTVRTQAGTGIAWGHAVTSKPICVTPCFADLKPGAHELEFIETDGDRHDRVDVQVNDTPKVVRHAIGDGQVSHGAPLPSYLLLALGAGGVLLTSSLLALEDEHNGSPSSFRTPVLIALGSSAAATLLSIPLILLSRNTHQRGSTTEFPLPLGPVTR